MYGTIFHMKAKPGQEQAVVDHFDVWEKGRRLKAEGALGGLVMKPDGAPGTIVAVAVFSSKATYEANADHPDQHKWYMGLRELLEEDPDWEDGEFVSQTLG